MALKSARRPGEPVGEVSALAVFDALSRQGRLAVFRRVARSGADGVDPGTLQRELRTTGSALTLHLRCLADAGLILPQAGRTGRFVANLDRLSQAVRAIADDCGAPGA